MKAVTTTTSKSCASCDAYAQTPSFQFNERLPSMFQSIGKLRLEQNLRQRVIIDNASVQFLKRERNSLR
ncbi:MAG: hypothetical protein EB015_05495 [Methylocystaceae bacterium]|nr:hypothetical protein [Methylocystaceae bacterium]